MSDVSTQVVAWIGAATGIGGLYLGIRNYARDVASLKLSVGAGYMVVNHPELSSQRTWGRIEVAHAGRRPIFFDHAELVLCSGNRAFPPRQSPRTLSEGSEPIQIWFDDDMEGDSFFCARARDGSGRWHYSRMSIVSRMRLQWLIMSGKMPRK